MTFPVSSSAVGVENPMHETYVCDDLKNMGFDLSKYPKDTSADWIKVIDFVEYGYDRDGDQSYYGLYLYIYNPSGKEILSGKNSVQMSFINSAGKEVPFAKYGVTRMSTSTGTGNEFVLYKLYIASSYSIGMQISGALTREYTISGIELQFDDSPYAKPVDNFVGATWTYSNYMKNFGSSLDNRLHKVTKIKECVSVKMEAASWYSKTSDLGEDYRYEVSSVYFNIPNTFIEAYGNPKDATSGLRTVTGEYYKYVTDGLIVPDETWYAGFSSFVNFDLNDEPAYYDGYIHTGLEKYKYGFYKGSGTGSNIMGVPTNSYIYDLSYNVNAYKNDLYYFYSSDVNAHICNLAISSDDESMYLNQEDFLATYNQWGRNSYNSTDGLSLKNADNFSGLGRVPYTISVTDGNLADSIKNWSSDKGAVVKWFYKLIFGEDYDISPIVEIKSTDLGDNMEPATIADNLYVMVEDVADIRTFYNEYSAKNHIYLMRLEVNPYYAPEVTLTTNISDGAADESNIATGIYFEKAVFEDIDIFTFTFEDEHGEYETVPVSCDPIDNVGAVTPGNNSGITNSNDLGNESRDDSMDWWLKFWEWFKDQEIGYKILVIIVIIIVIMLLIRLVGALLGVGAGAIVKAMGSIVSAPFKSANKVWTRAREKKSDNTTEKDKGMKIKVRKEKETHPGMSSGGLNSGREFESGKMKRKDKKRRKE